MADNIRKVEPTGMVPKETSKRNGMHTAKKAGKPKRHTGYQCGWDTLNFGEAMKYAFDKKA